MNVMTKPLRISEMNMMRMRGNRSTTTPPTSKKSSIGTWESTRTVPIAVAEPVFSSTHHAKAIRYKLSPRREVVCPIHSKAKGRCLSERSTFIMGASIACAYGREKELSWMILDDWQFASFYTSTCQPLMDIICRPNRPSPVRGLRNAVSAHQSVTEPRALFPALRQSHNLPRRTRARRRWSRTTLL